MFWTITATHTEYVILFQDELEAYQEGAVALMAVVNEEQVPAGIPFETHHMSVILSHQVLMSLRSWTDVLVILFGLVCAFHLSYVKKPSGFFKFIQRFCCAKSAGSENVLLAYVPKTGKQKDSLRLP